MKTPKLEICGWNPGAKDWDRVYIIERLDGATSPFLMDVSLATAKKIVEWARFHREMEERFTPR